MDSIECKESFNFVIAEPIASKSCNKILNGRNFIEDNPFKFQDFSNFDLLDYDEEVMNEGSN